MNLTKAHALPDHIYTYHFPRRRSYLKGLLIYLQALLLATLIKWLEKSRS